MATEETAPTWEHVLTLAHRLVAVGHTAPEDGLLLAKMVVDFDRSVHGIKSERRPQRAE